MLSRLAQYASYQQNMASRLSHELRTPVAVVRSSLENLQTQFERTRGLHDRKLIDDDKFEVAKKNLKRLSDAGVPVFAADVKGDLSGLAAAAQPNEKLLARAEELQQGTRTRPA